MPSYTNSHFIVRFLKFFGRNIFRNLPFLVGYSVLYCRKDVAIKINEYSFEEVSELIRQGKSLIRFGDGEVHIMNFGSIHYENFSNRLRSIFMDIVRGYTSSSPYALGLNAWALEKKNSELRAKGQLYCWLPLKVQYLFTFPKNVKYFDASLFYRKNIFEQYVLPCIQNKHIILISKKGSCDHVKANNFFESISYVVTPDFHSFTKFDEICKEVDNVLGGLSHRDVVLLVSCGPASKAICYRYAMSGVQSIDVGRGLELVGTDESLEFMLL